jgi:hypothetical protein
MYRWIWKLVVAVAAMVAIASTSWAQDEESTDCEDACYETDERCLAACEDQDDPVTCEEECAAAAERCFEECE